MDYLSEDFLKSLPLFSDLKSATIQMILDKGHVQHYKADQAIFFDKDVLPCIYLVLEGTASLYKTHATGHNKVIFMLGKGDLLNESLSDDMPSAINCKAYHDCVLLCLYKKDFLLMMQSDFHLMENVTAALSKRIRRLYRQLKNSTSVIKMEKKLAAKLWKLGHDYGVPCEEGILIQFPITITALADFLGSYRETISRSLKLLIASDLILYKNKHIIIPDPDKLSLYFKSS